MSTGLFLGAAFGAAVCLLLFALLPPRASLAGQVQRWERQRTRHVEVETQATATERGQDRLGAWLVARLAQQGITLAKLRANLELNDTSLEAHLVRKCSYGLAGLLLPAFFALALAVAGIGTPLPIPLAGGLIFAAVMFTLPDASVAQAAELRRTELRRALSCYLDLVAMSLAGGQGVPEALPAAARIGTGWAFELLGDTINGARYTGITPWEALADLGERTGMQELQDLGGSLLLVADDGAKVRTSLSARASTQRRRQLAEAEGEAGKADQTIQLAQVVLALGFLLFIGYPAVVAVLGV